MTKLPTVREQIEPRCVHFTGVQHATCGAGVAYDDVRDSSERPYRWPCCEDATTSCEKRVTPALAAAAS